MLTDTATAACTFAAGFGTGESRAVHALVVRHLRFIAQAPRHITHETHEALRSRLGRKLPMQLGTSDA